MIAAFEVAKYTRALQQKAAAKPAQPQAAARPRRQERDAEPTQHELDQRLADEQFIAWVLGTGYSAGHVPAAAPPTAPAAGRAGLRHAVRAATVKVGDRLLGIVALAYFGVLGDRGV